MSAERPSILITGATGFIGSYLLRQCLSEGWDTYAAVRRESHTERLDRLAVTPIVVDYADVYQMQEALSAYPPMDYVVHLAGLTKALSEETFMEANAENSRRLLETLQRQSTTPRRFLLVSSMSSYGAPPGDEPLRADMEQHPDTAYGRSKRRAEEYVRRGTLPYTILCPTGVYGRGDEDYHIALDTMRRGVSFLSGRSPQRLSFIHVTDVARAIVFLLQSPAAEGQTYLISDGRDYTDSDFTDTVSAVLRRRIHEVRIPIPLIRVVCHTGDLCSRLFRHPLLFNSDKAAILTQRNWTCDCTPLLDLGFRPQYDLASGMAEVLNTPGQ